MGLFTGFFSTVVIMAATVWFCLQGMLSVGMVIAFGQLIGKIINPVTELPTIIANFRTARPLQARMEKLMDGNRKAGAETLPGIRDGITLEQLSFRYQEDREVLQELSFRFENGRHYAIVGSSVLLLDEFTANLDERTAKEIEQRILARKDSLVITVTHRLNQEILRQYDRILVLSQGKLVASGTYEELQQKKALPVSGL